MNDYEYKKHLEDQLELCQEKDYILEQMEFRLHKMKAMTTSRLEDDLSQVEIEKINEQLSKLKEELQFLEHQLALVGQPIHKLLH